MICQLMVSLSLNFKKEILYQGDAGDDFEIRDVAASPFVIQ